ncbi:MAG: hypothetical protein ACP5UQ_00540 [Anaerolineae bacterium]
MNTDRTTHLGAIDALTIGLAQAARRPWLWLIPLAVDLLLWLAPKFSIADLTQRFLQGWEVLVRATYTPRQLELMSDMLRTVREGMTALSGQVNLLDTLAASWLGPPSAIANGQITRFTFISELILAPLGLAPTLPQIHPAGWQLAAIEVRSLWAVMLIVAVLWVAAQVIAVLWLRWAAAAIAVEPAAAEQTTEDCRGPFLAQVVQLMGFCLFLGILLFMLRLPLGAAFLLLMLSTSPLAGALFAIVGGVTLWITLWMLLSLYFTGEGLLCERQPVWRSMLQGAAMMRGRVLATAGLIALINLLLVGFRAVWGIIGQHWAGAVLAMLGNAYLGTAMLLAVFAYYGRLRQRWLAAQARAEADDRQLMRKEED